MRFNLLKNDKIVISIGIIILLISATGIFTWKDTGGRKAIPPVTPTGKTYKITWTEKDLTLPTKSEFTSKNEPTTLTITLDKDLITSVDFRLTWKDDKAFLGIFGKDTLTLKVTSPSGEEKEDSQKAKEGNITLTFSNLNSKPSVSEIKADTLSDAENEIQKYITSKGKGDWKVEISVKVGELLKFRDKGNDWELEVTYHYYEPQFAEASNGGNTGGEVKETVKNNEPTESQIREMSIYSMYKTFSAKLWL